MTTLWPTEASSVKLVSVDFPNVEFCTLVYDAPSNLLKIVDASSSSPTTTTTLDVIDVEDMIGATLHVSMPNESTARASSTNRRTTAPDTDATPVDTQSNASLVLATYPRQDPNQTSSWSMSYLLGRSSSYRTKPNPNYTRPSNDDLSKWGGRVAVHHTFQLAPAEDLKKATVLVNALRQLATQQTQTFKYLVIVNPNSGPKKNAAIKICNTVVQPMLEQAGIDVTVFVTERPKHAEERLHDADIVTYRGIVVVGGDGSLHEVVNGLQARSDVHKILEQIKIGVVGCGSANGFSTSVALESDEKYGPTDETFLICKGKSMWADSGFYRTTNKTYTSFLTFSWGIVADVDIESEKIKWIGETRFDLWAVLRILLLRTYRSRFSYLPASKADKSKPVAMPALTDPVPSDWTTSEDDFVAFWASNVSHASRTNHQSPKSRLQDGVFQIMIVRKGLSKRQLIRILLNIADGTHVDLPGVEFVECVAYRLEPLSQGSFNDIDGEVVEDGPIQANVLPKTVQVFCNCKA